MTTDAQILAEAVERRLEHLAHQHEAGQRALRRGWGLTAIRLNGAKTEHARVAAASGLRPMQDAVTWQNISPNVPIVGGYDDGIYAWPKVAWDTCRARGQKAVHYIVNPSHNWGGCLDVEQGDAVPAQAPGWVRMRRNSGEPNASVYCSVSVWPQVIGEFRAQGVPAPDYDIAAYPGIGPSLYNGAVAHQYADPGPVDLQVVAPFWALIDGSAPAPPPPPPPRKRGKRVNIFELPNGSLYVSDLVYFRWLNGADALKDAQYSIAKQGGDPSIGSVPRWQVMGVPADPGSASAAGTTYPGSAA